MNDEVLRLAVDARDLPTDTRGIGRYARAILRRLVDRPDVELTLLAHGLFPARHRAKMRAALRSDRFRVASSAGGCSLLWHPANGMFFNGHAPSVVTIHDAVPFRFPHVEPKHRDREQAPFLRSVRRASYFITVSNFARDELAQVFSLDASRVAVVYHGVDPTFSPGATLTHVPDDLRAQPYFLFVGDTSGLEPRKNFPLLYAAHRRAFDEEGPPLVVVGPNDPHLDGVRYAGEARGDASGAGDEFLRDFYCGALALCVPSYHETFGMPMIEAMACGTPVVACAASCLPEIGGHAALYAEPHDAQSWSGALKQIASLPQLRAQLRSKGLEQARRYDWNASATEHVQLFKRVVRESKARTN